jgi:hypothetical protein
MFGRSPTLGHWAQRATGSPQRNWTWVVLKVSLESRSMEYRKDLNVGVVCDWITVNSQESCKLWIRCSLVSIFFRVHRHMM